MYMKRICTKGIVLIMAVWIAAAGTVPVSAQQAASEKEEVVYGELSGDGSADRIYVVNIFENQKDIVDYGDYSHVRNMTSQDRINRRGDEITVHTEDDTLYYQGNLEEGQLPWDIGISYFLNGEKVESQTLAGKSGNLEIRIKIGENKKAFPVFFENYALQVTAAFDMEKCEKIKTKGATEANAGGNRQFTWTLLPETGRSIKIRTQVRNFEMDPISFNGVKLNMDVKVDSSELEKNFNDLSKTIAAIDAGAKKLSAGTGTFSRGAEQLSHSTDQLNETVKELGGKTKDIEKLSAASGEIKGAAGALSQGISKIKEEISYQVFEERMKRSGLDPDSLKTANRKLLETLAGLKSMEHIPAEYRQQILEAEQVLQGNLAALRGMEEYLEAAAKGISEAEAGAKELFQNCETFDKAVGGLSRELSGLDFSRVQELKKGADSLAQGSEKLAQGSNVLAGGTEALKQHTSGMSNRLNTAVEEVLSGISGKTDPATSFVSEKNTNVKAVQFVLKNQPVEIPGKEPLTEPESDELSWWQKLLKLFDLF